MSQKLKADYWRGLDFYMPSKDKLSHVIIVGCGAIGSYAALGFARMGVKRLTLIDHDTVAAHNIPNQFFAESLALTEDLLKTTILSTTIKYIVPDVIIKEIPIKWEEIIDYGAEIGEASAIITAVDKMEVRGYILDNYFVKSYVHYLLDSRTGGLYTNIFNIDMKKSAERDYYKFTLHTNEEASPLSCSGQSIVDVSMGVAADLVGIYRTLIMKGTHPSMHTFHDYSTGLSWIQQARKVEQGQFITTEENILAVGTEPENTEGR